MTKSNRILHIIYPIPKIANDAYSVSFPLTRKLLIKAGFKVITYQTIGSKKCFIDDLLKIIPILLNIDILYISIDGQTSLDKFTILKIFKPKLKIIWEIHGPAEEYYWFDTSNYAKRLVLLRDIKRKFLAKFVSASFCLTYSLKYYAYNALKIKNNYVLPSYIDKRFFYDQIATSNLSNFSKTTLKLKGKFIVFWGGSANLKWHALDLIEKVAENIYKLDKNIVFIVVGSNSWHQFTFKKNIQFYESMPYGLFLKFAKQADIFLTLFHPSSQKITGLKYYFSHRKIVEFMALGKPVIATHTDMEEQIIQNNINGYLVNNNPDIIAKLILTLKSKPTYIKQIGNKAKLTINHRYTLDYNAKIFSNALNNIREKQEDEYFSLKEEKN